MKTIGVLLLLFAQIYAQVFDLDLGGTWQLHNSNGSVKTNGQVPGDIFTDLIAAKVLGDPYYRYNDILYRWVGMESWTYTKSFEAPSDWANHKVLLWLEGVDTIADVSINGVKIQSVDNMFRRYQIDISKTIKLGQQNTIELAFTCASTYADRKAAEYPYPVTSMDGFMPQVHGVYNRNFIRKEQSTFGWDWGPAFIPQGIYKPIGIRVVRHATIDYVTPSVYENKPAWVVNVTVHIDSNVNEKLYMSAAITNGNTFKNMEYDIVPGKNTLNIVLQMSNVKLWWPRGYGEANLYDLSVKLHDSNGVIYDSKEQKIGFRTVRLVTDKIEGQPDERWMYFEVNGVAIFSKGANFIPSDSFEGRVTQKSIDDILNSAVDANMNTVRVWGGGLYQMDSFYEKTDELGLMVWQEFMFACAMYPRDKSFLENVKEEVRHQVRRLGHHTSLVLWSGNNENEIAFAWEAQTRDNTRLYVVDYSVLYYDTIHATLAEEETVRPFWPSSPSNGILSQEPLVGVWGDPGSTKLGDVHFYNYDFVCTDVTQIPAAKFASEYGFQSHDSLYTYRDVTLPEDLSRNSPLMNSRQHHPDGQKQLETEVGHHFKLAQETTGEDAFTKWSYLTQSMQSLCIKAQTEHYRRGRGMSSKTMGALYWQLNSIWQAPTWSSLEYGGRWKMLHYFVKNFFAPVLVSSFETSGLFSVHVTSDLNENVNSVAVMTLHSWSGKTLKTFKVPANMKPLESREIYNATVKDLISGNNKNDVFLTITLLNTKGVEISRNYQFFAEIKDVTLVDPKLNVTVASEGEKSLKLSVTSAAHAPYTWLASPLSGRFSDNGFLTVYGETRSITFTSEENIDVNKFRSTLSVMSMFNTQA